MLVGKLSEINSCLSLRLVLFFRSKNIQLFYVMRLEIEIDGDWVYKSTARSCKATSFQFHQLHTHILHDNCTGGY